jgi:hypothetical protein
MAANEQERFEQFSSVLFAELLERTKKNLELLVPEQRSEGPLPFALNPAFAEIYAEILKIGIFPIVISRRPVRAIVGDVNWAAEGREYLLTVLDDRSNAVFVAWDYAWESLWAERRVSAAAHAGEPAKERKGGFLGALFGGLRRHGKSEADIADADAEEAEETMEGMHAMLNHLAERRGFMPLFADDVKAFKGLVRTKPARLASAWKELTQYHQQEFLTVGKEQAKAGVLSENLQKWHYNLPERIGEFLVVRAAVDLDHVDKAFVGKYIRQSARSQEEAERGMPYLAAYWRQMRNR